MLDELRRWSDLARNAPALLAYERYAADWQRRTAAFLDFAAPLPRPASASSGAQASFADVPFAVKDNIAVKGFRMTCGSRILENFRVPYTATCVQRLLDRGAFVVGKTNLDEFGMGSSCETSAFGPSSNPYDFERVAGGSSGGSAAAVASGVVPFALGTDTGGSVRQPANFCGVYGLKPSYGSVSRFGLAAYASSLEGVGVLARSIDVAEAVFDAMRGTDPLDQSMPDMPTEGGADPVEPRSVGLIRAVDGLDEAAASAYRDALRALETAGLRLVELELPLWEYVLPAYYTIATAEASANLARYTGIAYGRRAAGADSPGELVRRSRTEGFGDEVKLRILLGTFVLRSGFQARYYLKAQEIRRAIGLELESALGLVDLIALPVFPTLAFRHGDRGMDAFQQKMADKFTCTANLAGLPALSLPTGLSSGLPTGIQLMAPAFCEKRLFAAARLLAPLCPPPRPPAFSEEFLP